MRLLFDLFGTTLPDQVLTRHNNRQFCRQSAPVMKHPGLRSLNTVSFTLLNTLWRLTRFVLTG